MEATFGQVISAIVFIRKTFFYRNCVCNMFSEFCLSQIRQIQKVIESARMALIRWRFLLHLLSPPFAPPRTVIFCRFLRVGEKQKIPISLGNQDFTIFCFSLKWCHQESNRGHKDFQSFALPTELWHQSFSFAVAKVSKVLKFTNIFPL